MRTTVLYLLLAAVAVSADLQSDIDDIAHHMPVEQLQLLGQRYVAAHPESREALEYLQTPQFDQAVKNSMKTKEINDIAKYLTSHGIDAEKTMLHWMQLVKELHAKFLEPMSPGKVRFFTTSLTGNMFVDLHTIIMHSDVPNVIRKKIETSPEFANLFKAVSDPEFKTLIFRAFSKGLHAAQYTDNKEPEVRGFFSNVWKKIKEGIEVGVAIPLGNLGK